LFTPQATLFDDAGTQAGPTGGNTLTRTTFIQRVNTVGGSAPSTGCAVSTDVGSKAFVPTGRITFSTRTPRGRDNTRGFVRQGRAMKDVQTSFIAPLELERREFLVVTNRFYIC
jgi:hypothetical protein